MKNSDYLTKFVAYLLTERCFAQNTVDAYKRDVEQFVTYLDTNSFVIKSLTIEQIKQYLRNAYEKSALSEASRARKISSLKAFLRFLETRYDIAQCSSHISVPKVGKTLPQYLSTHEVQQLFIYANTLTSLNGMRNKVMLYLLYATGMRVSELVAVRVDACNMNERYIVVQGKGDKQRIIPLNTDIMKLMRLYLIDIRPAILKKASHVECNWLFPVFYRGKLQPMTRQSYWSILKKMCKAAEIRKNVSPHQLRHSLATHMLHSGVDLRTLQMLLGHENIATVQVYTHVDTTFLREVYDKKHPRSD